MAACPDRAAASTSGFEETDMTTASGVAPSVVSGTTPLPPAKTGASGGTLATTADSTLAGDFQTFLTLLTTQLQNQNPLDPLDTNQFTQQLVQFAGVEQQLKTNDQLTSLVSLQQTAQATQALGFVAITIANSTGQNVFSGNYSVTAGANQAFSWDGKGNDGTQWPDGKYTLTATAVAASGKPVAVSTQIQGVVNSVDLTQTPPLLSINGQTYTVSQIKSITN